jgi:hypothetical protein
MSTQGVKLVIATLISSPQFKRSFFANKVKALKGSGFDLTPREMEALRHLRQRDINMKVKITDKISKVIIPVKILPPGKILKKRGR